MNKRGHFFLLFILLPVIFLHACATGTKKLGEKHYQIGMQLNQAEKYKEAMAYLDQAIASDPDNQKYQQALEKMRGDLINKYIKEGMGALEAGGSLTLMALDQAKAALVGAKEVDPNCAEVISFNKDLNSREEVFMKDIEELYSQAKQYTQNKEWLKAYVGLQQLQSLFPNYEDSRQCLIKVTRVGSEEFYKKAKKQMEENDIKGALENLRQTLSLRSEYKEARNLMSLAKERDNVDYFLKLGKKEATNSNWDKAIRAYQQAFIYKPEDDNLKIRLEQAQQKAANYYIKETQTLADQGWLCKAFENYKMSKEFSRKGQKDQITKLGDHLCVRAKYAAECNKEDARFGAAWYWYKQIESINPEYPRIFYLIQSMEDEINQRVKKSIAVFDFSSPVGSSDAGIIVANNLITFLFKTASGDIQILERENLKSILEEMKLGQIGVVSGNSAREIGRIYGIDVAIMGSVLLYKVDSTSSEGTKTVRYQIGEKITDNIEYMNWKVKHPKPNKKELAEAPPAKIFVPEYTEKEYTVSYHKKIAFAQLSFRIVDVTTGENIQVKTIERKQIAEDEGSAGLPEANITFDPVEIPSDTEILQKISEEVVAELGREALKPLQNLEKTYFQDGEKYLRRQDSMIAAEHFINALFDEKLKRIQNSPQSTKALEYLDEIFLNHQITLKD